MPWQDKYFVKIDGVSYKAELLNRAKVFASAGPLGVEQAEALWKFALDGRGVTATERRTLRHIAETLPLQPDARAYLAGKLGEDGRHAATATADGARGGKGRGKGSKRTRPEHEEDSGAAGRAGAGGSSGDGAAAGPEKAEGRPSRPWWLPSAAAAAWRRLFGGRPGADSLLRLAAERAKDGVLDLRDVQALWRAALDGHRVMEAVARTQLAGIAGAYALDEAAREFLFQKLSSVGSAGSPAVPARRPAFADCTDGPKSKKRQKGPFTAVFYRPGCGNGSVEALVDVLSSASRSLDVALFVLTDDRLASVLTDQHKAGVRVRVLADRDAEEAFESSDLKKLRKAGIEVRLDRSKLHMHHKFAVVDGEVCVNGSLNWTTGALMNNWENIVISRSASVAAVFSAEFDRLWGALAPGMRREPGPAPTGRWSGDHIVLFFPDDMDANFKMLLAEIRSAKTSLDVAVFTLTVAELKAALKDANRRGVRVRIVTDDRQAKHVGGGSHLRELRAAGLEVRLDGAGGNMHHKFCVVDGTTVCNGSFNWTRQAEDGNNENIIIYRNEPGLARSFTVEFERLWSTFAGR